MNYLAILLSFNCLALPFLSADNHDYRIFDETSPQHVRDFYIANHTNQTLEFVLEKKSQYLPPKHFKLSIWEALDLLDTIVDQSDPDIDLPQSYHCYQTAEAMRAANQPRWLIATAFIHDLGKILCLNNEPQWAVVGDTFPVGCAFTKDNVFPEYFKNNPDQLNPDYNTKLGIYTEGCGWDNVHFSWGHDEYLYQVVKDVLPPEGAYIIRYHSFYPGHLQNAYTYLMNDKDREMLSWVQRFQKYDLYSKNSEPLDLSALKPFYKELIAEFFPDPLWW